MIPRCSPHIVITRKIIIVDNNNCSNDHNHSSNNRNSDNNNKRTNSNASNTSNKINNRANHRNNNVNKTEKAYVQEPLARCMPLLLQKVLDQLGSGEDFQPGLG